MPGDSAAPQTSESTREMMEAFTETMPAFMQAMNSQVGPAAMAQLGVAQKTSPAYAQLTQDLYSKYAPLLANTGRQIDTQNRLSAAETDARILDTSGRKLADTYKSIDQGLNPEYYKARSEAGGKLSELLGSINLNNASPEAERLVNQENIRSGNLGNNNATNTVSNALSFGKEMDNRRSQLSNAINTATQFLTPSSNSAFNPATAALNRPTSSTGLSQFGGVDRSGSEAYSSGNNLMGQIGQTNMQENQINANRRDTLDRMNEVTSSL
jgi:hypothetical protein